MGSKTSYCVFRTMEIKVCKISEIENKKGKLFEIKKKKIAIFRVNKEVYALNGMFEKENIADSKLIKYIITVPFENIKVDIRTGEFILAPENKIKTYKTKIKKEEIYLELE